jgi:hypothetical protein
MRLIWTGASPKWIACFGGPGRNRSAPIGGFPGCRDAQAGAKVPGSQALLPDFARQLRWSVDCDLHCGDARPRARRVAIAVITLGALAALEVARRLQRNHWDATSQ